MTRMQQNQIDPAQKSLAEEIPPLQPWDQHNQRLADNTHPPGRQNPKPNGRYNLVVIGAGTAGLVTAAGAAGLGAKVALIERQLTGGDCLNVGCVPSKALIRSARAAAEARHPQCFGIHIDGPVRVDFTTIMERMRRLRADISTHDSVQRFQEMGIDVYIGSARFLGPDRIQVDNQTLEFARAVIATGTRPTIPPIPGLEETGYLTNETIFSLTNLPDRLAVIGAGPIGCELAQAFTRFGSQVTLIEAGNQILPKEDADAAAIVEKALRQDGVEVVCGGKAAQVSRQADEKVIQLECGDQSRELIVDQILVAVGRTPNIADLNLESAGVIFDSKKGVEVNDYLQSSNSRIYAAGDICSKYKFTHAADAMARIVIQNSLFFGRARASRLIMPWCTYTEPEIAHVGMYEQEARGAGIEVTSFKIALSEVDRAVLDGEDEGFLKVHVRRGKDEILGATLVASHAGEIISEITAMMVAGAGLGTFAKTIHPYPTQAEVIKRAGDQYNRGRLTPARKRVLSSLLQWRR